MSTTLERSIPFFLQISEKIRRDIISGHYAPDTQIPSVRQIACELSANPNTVQRALLLLEDEGLLYTKGTLGRFVTPDEQLINEAAERARDEVLRGLLAEAYSLGITGEKIIEFIKKEGALNE